MFCQFDLFSILIQKRFAYLTVIIELKKSYVVKMLQLTWHSLLMNLKRCFYCKNMLCDELFTKDTEIRPSHRQIRHLNLVESQAGEVLSLSIPHSL